MADLSNNSVFSQTDGSNNSGTVPTWAEGMAPSQVNDSARALQGALKRFYDHVNGTATSGGTANAQTLTYAVAPSALVAGDRYTFKVGPGLTNTGATSLNINGLGTISVALIGSALVGGELRGGQIVDVVYDGTNFQLIRPAATAVGGFAPANPTGTTSAGGVMMGIGTTCAITPLVSGDLKIHLVGDVNVSVVAGNPATIQAQIRYGTGTAPANAAALTGTTAGSLVTLLNQATTTNDRFAFSLLAYVSGLTIGTAYWIDISLSSATGNTALVRNLYVVVEERPR